MLGPNSTVVCDCFVFFDEHCVCIKLFVFAYCCRVYKSKKIDKFYSLLAAA